MWNAVHLTDTWFASFQSMLRIQKRYVFNYGQTDGADKTPIPGRVSTFSSYPGILSSQVRAPGCHVTVMLSLTVIEQF